MTLMLTACKRPVPCQLSKGWFVVDSYLARCWLVPIRTGQQRMNNEWTLRWQAGWRLVRGKEQAGNRDLIVYRSNGINGCFSLRSRRMRNELRRNASENFAKRFLSYICAYLRYLWEPPSIKPRFSSAYLFAIRAYIWSCLKTTPLPRQKDSCGMYK